MCQLFREAQVGGGVWHEYILFLKEQSPHAVSAGGSDGVRPGVGVARPPWATGKHHIQSEVLELELLFIFFFLAKEYPYSCHTPLGPPQVPILARRGTVLASRGISTT